MDTTIIQKKTQINESFYTNVSLLAEFVPPNAEFRKHFCKGMFDKPNTQGFIRVSHYLLSIYNKDQFEKHCKWPVICKTSEVEYRNDVKKYLEIIAQENQDMDFPTILPTFLIQASGMKFMIIMWKLSTVTLRTYLKIKESVDVCLFPKAGPTFPLMKEYFVKVIHSSNIEILNHLRESAEIEGIGKDAIQKEGEEILLLKRDIKQRTQNIAHLVSNLPSNLTDKLKPLSNDHSKIIESFQKIVDQETVELKKEIENIKEIEELSEKLLKIILKDGAVKLDGNQMVQIDTQHLSESSLLSPENQAIVLRLYNDEGKLSLVELISLFYRVLIQINHHLKDNPLEEVSNFLEQIEASNKDLQSIFILFEDLLKNITQSLTEKQQQSSPMKVISSEVDDTSSVDYNDIFQSSPVININLTDKKYDLKTYLKECIPLTPDTEKLSSLFSKHRRPHDAPSTPTTSSFIRPTRVNFDDSIASNIGIKKNSFTVKKKALPPELKNKYSRLFEKSINHNYEASCSFMMNTSSMVGQRQSSSFNSSYNLSIPKNEKNENNNNPISPLNCSSSTSITGKFENIKKELDEIPSGQINRLSLGDLLKKYNKVLENRKHFQELEKEDDNFEK